ncbi:MAG: hypothetical protein ACRED9_09135 [Caulobacteraceae bacterium]
MAFSLSGAVSRVNLHTAIQALAFNSGGIFFIVYLVKRGLSPSMALIAIAAIFAVRFCIRPAILPLAIRVGLLPLLLIGNAIMAIQYPILSLVHGLGPALFALIGISALADIVYWPAYNAYFSAVGDAERRGRQTAAREALTAAAGIIAPLAGGFALARFGAHGTFAAVALVQLAAMAPLIGAPNVKIAPRAAGGAFAGLRLAGLGSILMACDGWLASGLAFVWQIALFAALKESYAAYGGAMALAGVVGASCGLLIGAHVDFGGGRRAAALTFLGMTAIVVLRAASLHSPALAVVANAVGALWGGLMVPTSTAIYNLAKTAPCPMRFWIVGEGGWDIGCVAGSLLAAGLISIGVSLAVPLLLTILVLAASAILVRRYFHQTGKEKTAASAAVGQPAP